MGALILIDAAEQRDRRRGMIVGALEDRATSEAMSTARSSWLPGDADSCRTRSRPPDRSAASAR